GLAGGGRCEADARREERRQLSLLQRPAPAFRPGPRDDGGPRGGALAVRPEADVRPAAHRRFPPAARGRADTRTADLPAAAPGSEKRRNTHVIRMQFAWNTQ